MPTINFALADMEALIGKRLTEDDLDLLMTYAKGEFENYDKKTNEVTVSLDDTNLPYLWSAEGLARLFKGVLKLEKGHPKLEIKKSDYTLEVDKSVKEVRPHIAAFVAKGKKIDDYLLKQLVQLQEKFCESYGRRRQKVSIGLYSYKRITFPVKYTTVAPEKMSFVPLEMTDKLTLKEILEENPKGKEYGWILKDAKKYPILLDSKDEVLSFPPIINSNFTGRVEADDTDVFFEVTGTDEESILLATNIFAQALYDRGFDIFECKIKAEKPFSSPKPFNDSIVIPEDLAQSMLGLDLSKQDLLDLLKRARYDISGNKVMIPDYRRDILHPVDVVEDIAVMFGYENIPDAPLSSYTIGKRQPMTLQVNKTRDMVAGAGYLEVMSPILSNKSLLYEKMHTKDFGTVEISEYMSETYSVVRSWLTPILMDVLSKNTHVEYPQRIFEQGLTTQRTGSKITDSERIALATAHSDAGFTEIKQALDVVMKAKGVLYTLEPKTNVQCFIPGREASIIVNKKQVGIIGEISPQVLSTFGVEVPVSTLELDLSLF